MSSRANCSRKVDFHQDFQEKKKGRKIHEQVKMATKLFIYFCGPIVNYLTLHPTPNWNKGSPKGWWQFSLLEYLFSALRSWWKTCSMGRNCLGVIPSESIDIIRVSLLIKSSTHYFPLHEVFFWSLSYQTLTLFLKMYPHFLNGSFGEIQDSLNVQNVFECYFPFNT